MREFLKPNWRKIVVFLILLFFLGIPSLLDMFILVSCATPRCSKPIKLPWRKCPLCREVSWKDYLSGVMKYLMSPSNFLHDFFRIFDLFLTSVAYYWLISCLMISIHRKVKK
jgi:hypothetical protein